MTETFIEYVKVTPQISPHSPNWEARKPPLAISGVSQKREFRSGIVTEPWVLVSGPLKADLLTQEINWEQAQFLT